jgi:hypothetical protein
LKSFDQCLSIKETGHKGMQTEMALGAHGLYWLPDIVRLNKFSEDEMAGHLACRKMKKRAIRCVSDSVWEDSIRINLGANLYDARVWFSVRSIPDLCSRWM